MGDYIPAWLMSHKLFWNSGLYLQMIFTIDQEFNRSNGRNPWVGLSQIRLSCHCEKRWEREHLRYHFDQIVMLQVGAGYLIVSGASRTCLALLRPWPFSLDRVSSVARRGEASLSCRPGSWAACCEQQKTHMHRKLQELQGNFLVSSFLLSFLMGCRTWQCKACPKTLPCLSLSLCLHLSIDFRIFKFWNNLKLMEKNSQVT